jgi:L-seryl-tRNA(Ser) seleniumtransferase
MIPPVDEVLAAPEIADLRARSPRFPWTPCVRDVLAAVRAGRIQVQGATRESVKAAAVAGVVERVKTLEAGGQRRVINATGVILHTNLGRSVIGARVRDAATEAMGHYVDLEIDLKTGKRSSRGEVLNELVRLATGAESAMVVNNNAAAVYLVVGSYSPPGRILVSRGELVEIGGSFRLPDILKKAASETIELGTTNRTYIDDYAKHARKGDILMRAHRSNYDIQGFTHDTELADLAALARERECHVVYDLGSGSLFDFAALGLEGEERVDQILSSGVDCVTMSGDKLLGGVQAGIIVGGKKFLDGLRQNPLRRAVRIDKVSIAAMQALMRSYLFADNPAADIPTLALAASSTASLRRRALAIIDGLPAEDREAYRVEVVEDDAALGGGSFAVQSVASVAIALRCASEGSASDLARSMRGGSIPVLSRIKGSEVRLNMKSVMPHEDGDLRRVLAKMLRG